VLREKVANRSANTKTLVDPLARHHEWWIDTKPLASADT